MIRYELPAIAFQCPECDALVDSLLRIEVEETVSTYMYTKELGWHNRVSGPTKSRGRSRWECPVCRKEIEYPYGSLVQVNYTTEPFEGNIPERTDEGGDQT